MDRQPKVAAFPTRRTSEVADFPWASPRLCWILVFKNGTVEQPHYVDERRAAIKSAKIRSNPQLYIAWPGEYSTDLFLVDNPEAAHL